jgi:hypothetical protein
MQVAIQRYYFYSARYFGFQKYCPKLYFGLFIGQTSTIPQEHIDIITGSYDETDKEIRVGAYYENRVSIEKSFDQNALKLDNNIETGAY